VAGQRNFVRRLTVFAHGVQLALYLAAFVSARSMTVAVFESSRGVSEQLSMPSVFFAAMFLAGTAAAHLEYFSVRWLMPVVSVVAAVLMSGFV
jgi:hypothetical protein